MTGHMPEEKEAGAGANLELSRPLRILRPEQIVQVDGALASLGPFGEVRLVKVKGRLRFIERVESYDLLAGSGPPEGE